MDKPFVQPTYEFEDFQLDPGQLLLLRDGEELSLPPKAIETLLVLVENRGKIVSKDQLIKTVWRDVVVEESNLYGYLHTLRNSLGDQKNGKPFIETLRRRGYRFNADTRVVTTTAQDSEVDDSGQNSKNLRFVFWLSLGLILIAGMFLAAFYWPNGSAMPTAAGNLRKIAILPFKPLAADSRDPTLEVGMAGALISRLSGTSEIEVRPMGSASRFDGIDPSPIEIGNVLGVDAVVQGGIQRIGDRIRVEVRLIKTADGGAVWESTFEKAYADILTAQDEIANEIKAKIAPEFARNNAISGTGSVEAWEYYVKAKYLHGALADTELKKSIENYQRAIDLDPNYADAYAGLARGYVALPLATDFQPNEALPKAKEAARRALAINDRSAESRAVYGSILFWYEWDWKSAEEQCSRAIELDPNSAEAQYIHAHLMSNLGRHPEALLGIQRARELDPVNLRFDALEAQFLLHAGQTDEALKRLHKVVERVPQLWIAHLFISSAYIEKGCTQKQFLKPIWQGNIPVRAVTPRLSKPMPLPSGARSPKRAKSLTSF